MSEVWSTAAGDALSRAIGALMLASAATTLKVFESPAMDPEAAWMLAPVAAGDIFTQPDHLPLMKARVALPVQLETQVTVGPPCPVSTAVPVKEVTTFPTPSSVWM